MPAGCHMILAADFRKRAYAQRETAEHEWRYAWKQELWSIAAIKLPLPP